MTGLDVELIKAMTDELSHRCGRPITPVLHLVRFRDLFRLLNEDIWIGLSRRWPPLRRHRAAPALPIPCPTFTAAVSAGSPRSSAVIDRVQANVTEQTLHPAADRLAATSHALDGLTIAVQAEVTRIITPRPIRSESLADL
ncbi:MAG: hypothetical protein MRJ92_09915 [Nitrospira sp.]|nr:hypothetical protein [Nitrospira sp.]